MSRPVLYVYHGSVWASAPQLAAHELGYGDQLEKEHINLPEGANFHPSFLKLNPNATIPTLVTLGKVHTTTVEVVRYLVENAPEPVGTSSGTDIIEKLHDPSIDPNFSLLSTRSEGEIKVKADGAVGHFVRGRQATLDRIAPTTFEHKAFYDAKIAENGFLKSIFDETAPPQAVQAYIARSNAHWKNVSQFISTELPKYLPESGFIGGENPGEDDFHLAAWLARTVGVTGGSAAAEGVTSLESELGGKGTVPKKVETYWRLWSERESWKIQYAQGLH